MREGELKGERVNVGEGRGGAPEIVTCIASPAYFFFFLFSWSSIANQRREYDKSYIKERDPSGDGLPHATYLRHHDSDVLREVKGWSRICLVERERWGWGESRYEPDMGWAD